MRLWSFSHLQAKCSAGVAQIGQQRWAGAHGLGGVYQQQPVFLHLLPT